MTNRRDGFRPILKYRLGTLASCEFGMPHNQGVKQPGVCLFQHRFEVYGPVIAPSGGKVASFVKNICEAAAHTCSKIPAASAENDHRAARHVFTAVIPNAFNDSCRA